MGQRGSQMSERARMGVGFRGQGPALDKSKGHGAKCRARDGGASFQERTFQNTNQIISHSCSRIPHGPPCLQGNVHIPCGSVVKGCGSGPLPSFLCLISRTFPGPSSQRREGCTSQRERWEVCSGRGRAPPGGLRFSSRSCVRPAPHPAGPGNLGPSLSKKRMLFHVIAIPWLTCLLKSPTDAKERNFIPHGS